MKTIAEIITNKIMKKNGGLFKQIRGYLKAWIDNEYFYLIRKDSTSKQLLKQCYKYDSDGNLTFVREVNYEQNETSN